jgi:predicted outer membrane protein
MALEKKHEQLNDEILALAKAGDYVSIKKNVDLQRKISEILQEKQKEQEIFDKRNFQDDILYQKAQELGDQELLDKFHSHSLTREKYINACKNLNIDL